MKSPKYRVTLKVLSAYILLGILATISGFLLLTEIRTLSEIQGQDIEEQNKILKIGSLITNIYENESLVRATILLNSSKKFKQYITENDQLLEKIDSLHFTASDTSQVAIIDSIKVIVDKKLKNLIDLRKLKQSYNSEEPISRVIQKLSSVDSLLSKVSIDELLKTLKYLDTKIKINNKTGVINKHNPKNSTDYKDEKQIDSLVSASKDVLENAQKEAINQRLLLLRKERELIENDLIISRKLQELLDTLEKGVLLNATITLKQREKTLYRSKNIILLVAGIGLIIIIFFSIIILNDFWKSQRYRKQLEKANKKTASLLQSREQIISMVSHDLRTPLSTITGYSELLQKKITDTKEKNYADHIWNASTYMGQLVDDLMVFSKLESGTIALQKIPFDLEKQLNDIILSSKSYIQNKEIVFKVLHDENITNSIISDLFRIKQILYNLITNACKFTEKGSVTIKSTLIESKYITFLEISITDTGIGISKDQQKTIFKAFTQVESTTETNQNGFGLGLTISKKLASLLKGTLTLKSDIDIGSTFTLKIPVTLSEIKAPILKTIETLPNVLLTAIIVEDDLSMCQLIEAILKQYHIKTYAFNNAKMALNEIHKIKYDLVLTDIQLPKINGFHFMSILKKHSSYKNQPIIAMTGRLNQSRKDYIDSGFSEVLAKPFHSKELQNILQNFFGSSFLSENKKIIANDNEHTNGFDISSLNSFFNNDSAIVKKTLKTFLEETNKNYLLLIKAKTNNDIYSFNSTCHGMLGMLKQLNAKTVIPFLLTFEKGTVIDEATFSNFEIALKTFLKSVETYLN